MQKHNFKLKTIAAALALMAGSAVQAAPTVVADWGTHDVAEMGGNIMFSTGTLLPFDHVYLFNLASGYNGLVTSVSNDAVPVFDIQNGLVRLWKSDGDSNYTNDTLVASLSFDSTAVNTTWSLLAGDYYYEVTGNVASGSFGGSYLISSNLTSPVPEPETYAMLLAGLGLIGFSLRRRAV